jgi:glyoxylase I family protein
MTAPPVTGFTHVSLSVSDLGRSLAFYRDTLGLGVLAEPYEGTAFDGTEAMLVAGRTALCLQCHRANSGDGFDPRRTGLDHIALRVGNLDDLHAFAEHLDRAGVAHSGVKPLTTYGHFIELHDPDGILVELHTLPA